MDHRLRNFYNESRVKNASPGELLVILYDDLVQSAEIAENQMAAAAKSAERIQAPFAVARCINLLAELNSALRPEHDPALCGNLSSLYRFFVNEFSAALEKNDAGKIGAILPLLRKLRTTWTKAQKISGRTQLVAA